MRHTILILLDHHQFNLLSNLKQCEVVIIGNDYIPESTSVIFHDYDKYQDEFSGKILIRNGAWKEEQYTEILGTTITLLEGYTIEGVRRPLGLSGVRNPDKID